MKRAIQMICLFSTLAGLGLSASAFGSPQSPRGDLSENSPTISEPEPPIPVPVPGTEFTMRMVEPSRKNVEARIRYAMPDPSIHYTIRNVRPELNIPFVWGNTQEYCRPK